MYYKFFKSDETSFLHGQSMLEQSQLFVTTYERLRGTNDSEEGIYYVDSSVAHELRDQVRAYKKQLLIGCVTNKVYNAHMWREFASNGQGICIAIEIKERDVQKFPIKYRDGHPYISNKQFEKLTPYEIATQVLQYKLSTFSGEDETRFLLKAEEGVQESYIRVKIRHLYLGRDISELQEIEYRRIAQAKHIKVRKWHQQF